MCSSLSIEFGNDLISSTEEYEMSVQDAPTAVKIGRKVEGIMVSPNAAAKVAQLIASENDPSLALRVAVRPGGCSGFSYEMFFDSDIAEDDIVKEFGDVRVVTDPASASMLKGATLDYKDALQGGGFAIDNPNAQRTCGCGNSFS
jgi:iron-sulfur cluster assembly accessory protein